MYYNFPSVENEETKMQSFFYIDNNTNNV